MKAKGKTGLEWLTMPFILRLNARRFPDKEAIIDYTYRKRFTYHESWLRTNKIANALIDLGIGEGDKIAYLGYNREELLHLLYAVATIKAIVVPLNFRLTLEQWISQVNHSDSTVLVCEDVFMEKIDQGRRNMPAVKHYIGYGDNIPANWINFEQIVERSSDKSPNVEAEHNDIVSISYTSGTTGEPKGVLRTQSSWIGYAIANDIVQRTTPRSRIWTLMDLIHQGGIFVSTCSIVAGATVVLLDRFEPEKALEMIYRERLNDIYPTYVGCNMMSALPQAVKDKYDLTHVEHVWASGATWPHWCLMQARKLFPNAKFAHGLLSTEGLFTVLEDEGIKEEYGPENCEGPAWYGTEIKITDLDFRDEVPDGEYGVLWARGIGSADGFYKNPELQKKLIRDDGWVTSEDCGYIDPKTKRFWFVDRAKDIVRSGAENVPTTVVEDVVKKHPKIANCGVIGTPHKELGETVTAIVELKPGETLTAEELMEWCRDKLPGPYRPRRVEFVSEVPVVGFKRLVDKKLLRATYVEKYKI